MVLCHQMGNFMVLMTPIVGHAVNTERGSELFERCLRAADVYWQVDNLNVIMPVFDSPEAQELRGLLQGIGLTVFNGPSGIGCDDWDDFGKPQLKVMMFHASDWHMPAARRASAAIREVFPEVTICVITGVLPLTDPFSYPHQPVFDDARALLQSAGIGFFSIEGVCNEL